MLSSVMPACAVACIVLLVTVLAPVSAFAPVAHGFGCGSRFAVNKAQLCETTVAPLLQGPTFGRGLRGARIAQRGLLMCEEFLAETEEMESEESDVRVPPGSPKFDELPTVCPSPTRRALAWRELLVRNYSLTHAALMRLSLGFWLCEARRATCCCCNTESPDSACAASRHIHSSAATAFAMAS